MNEITYICDFCNENESDFLTKDGRYCCNDCKEVDHGEGS